RTRQRGLSRRELLKRAAMGAAALTGTRLSLAGTAQTPANRGPAIAEGNLVLVNGKFVDGRGVVGSTLTIRNGRIASVGRAMILGPGARRIDLGGRTVIPGLADAHVHYTRAGVNPGHEARRIQRAFSIAALQDAI